MHPAPFPAADVASLRLIFLTLVCLLRATDADGQTSAFTYQGHLMDGGASANGNYDVQFTLKNALSGGATVGAPQTIAPLSVVNGIFITQLDFGGAMFDGSDRFIELAVRPFGSVAAYTVLAPRQKITSAPYAVKSQVAASAGSASSLSGTLTGANIPAGTITSGMITSGIDAAKLNTGVVSNAELNFLDGVTSGIQGQLDGKLNKAGDTMAGGLTVGGNGELIVAGPTARFAVNTNGYPYAAATIRGRAGDDGIFILETSDGNAAFGMNSAGNAFFYGNLTAWGAASRFSLNTIVSPSVTAAIKGLLGDTNILSLKSSGGADVFTVNDAGNTIISGSVGIGIATPTATLDVNGTAKAAAFTGNGAALTALNAANIATGALADARLSSNVALLNRSPQTFSGANNTFTGNLGLGQTSTGAKLHIKAQSANSRDNGIRLEHALNTNRWNIHTEEQFNNLTFSFNDQFPGGNYSYMNATQAGLISVSDRTAKKDIAPLTGALEHVARLRPVSFRYKSAPEDSPPNYGFIAQEVEEVYPDLVLENNGLKTLASNSLTAINTRAVQELNAKHEADVKALREENETLRKESADLKARLERLEKALEKGGGR